MIIDSTSNWDICPVCLKAFYESTVLGTDVDNISADIIQMRDYHKAHKEAEK